MTAPVSYLDELAERRMAERSRSGPLLALRANGSGRPVADEENVRLILATDPALAGFVQHDDFSYELLLCKPIPGTDGGDDLPRRWRDEDTVNLQTYIQRDHIPRIGRDKVAGALKAYARTSCVVHPLRDYLRGLRWDGTERLDRLLIDYMGAEATPLHGEFGARWMISAVARVMRPGCQADYALVLEGPQGIGKTSALRALCPSDDYFSDSLPHDLASKDAKAHSVGKWIIELSELTQFRKSEIETVKGFLSRREEKFRPAYGRNEVIVPRQCVFAGTTNESEYLVDSTGNRRFWCVAVSKVDVAAIERDRDQLWAEAAHRFDAGERWHLSPDMEREAAGEAAKRVTFDPLLVTVHSILKSGGRLGGKLEVTPSDILAQVEADVIPARERTPATGKRIGALLLQLGWTKGRRVTRGQLFLRPDREVSLT